MGYDPDGTWNLKDIFKVIATALVVAVAVVLTAAAAVATGGLAGVAIMSVATGMAFGSIGGGVSAAINGTDITAGILCGFVKGAAVGFAVGMGIATGAGAFSLIGGLAAFGASVSVNMMAGMINYGIDNTLNGREKNWEGALISGGFQALSSAFAFFGGTVIGASGFYNIPGKDSLLSVKGVGNAAFGFFVKFITYYPFDYAFNYFKNKIIFS